MKQFGVEFNLQYELFDDFFIMTDYSFVHSDADADFPSYGIDDIERGITENMIGAGIRYTYKRLDIDLYTKYMQGITHVAYPYQLARGIENQRIAGYFTTMLRIAYEFVIPSSSGATAEVEFVARDFHAGRWVETERNYLVEPQIYGGMKIKF